MDQIEQYMAMPVEERLLSLDELIAVFHSLTASSRVESQRASSSWQQPPVPGSTAQVVEVAELLRSGIAGDLMTLEAEDQEQSRRELVMRMVEETRSLGSQLRTMLLLLPEFLPQPNRLRCCDRHVQYGADAMRRLRHDMHLAYGALFETDVGNEPFGLQEVVVFLQQLSTTAIDSMTFLESGGDVLGSDHETELGELQTAPAMQVDLPENMLVASSHDAGTGGLGFATHLIPGETQTTRATGSTSPATTGDVPGVAEGLDDEGDDPALPQLRVRRLDLTQGVL